MKKSLLFALCLVAFFACKKEGGSGKQLYLGKIFSNDLLSEEYLYSSDMKVIRRNYYNTSGGSSQFSSFRIFEYEDGLMSRVLHYSQDGELNNKKVIMYNDSKKVTRVDYYGSDDEIDSYGLFQYNNNQLEKIITYTTNPVKKSGEWHFSWNGQNRIASLKRYWISSGNLILSDSVHFAWSGKTVPDHWQLYEELMLEFPADKTIEGMFADSYYYYISNAPPIISTHTFTQKIYNGQGYLTAQHYNIAGSNGLGPINMDYNLKYEYIE
jgi:hypothetical protein